MKREGNIFPYLISDCNIERAIRVVNSTHRTRHGRKNETVLWVDKTIEERIEELRQMILDGFTPSPCRKRRRWDRNAKKFRDICEPKIWHDQYIHHILVQALQHIMLRGMDHWCCGSIPGRGIDYGIKGIRKWITTDKEGTTYAAELDIYHFYDSIQPRFVMKRLRHLIKDEKVLDLVWRIIKNGISIGAYCSQWFANTLLQPLDQFIRTLDGVEHYIRYMDNITLFGRNKKKLHIARRRIASFLKTIGLKLKSNWQIFPIEKRPVNALGYRFYSNGKIVLRKNILLRTKREVKKAKYKIDNKITMQYEKACGLMSRLACLNRANCYNIYAKYEMKGLKRELRRIISYHAKLENKKKKQKLEQEQNKNQP